VTVLGLPPVRLRPKDQARWALPAALHRTGRHRPDQDPHPGRSRSPARAAPDEAFQRALTEIDDDLTDRIRSLCHTQRRLRELASGRTRPLPAEVDHHLQQPGELGFSERWVTLESDLRILVFATHPDTAHELFRDQAQALTDPALRQLYLDYDRARDFDPPDPFLADLARRIIDAATQRYGTGDLPGQATGSEIPQLIQGAVNASSPAWRRLDSLIRDGLQRASERAGD